MRKLHFLRMGWVAAMLGACVFMAVAPAQAADTKPTEASSVVNGLRIKRLVTPLSLTADQQKQFKALMDEESKKIAESQANTAIERTARIADQRKIQAEYRKKLEEVLTQEQRDKWAKMDADAQASRRRRSGSTPAKPASESKPAPAKESSSS